MPTNYNNNNNHLQPLPYSNNVIFHNDNKHLSAAGGGGGGGNLASNGSVYYSDAGGRHSNYETNMNSSTTSQAIENYFRINSAAATNGLMQQPDVTSFMGGALYTPDTSPTVSDQRGMPSPAGASTYTPLYRAVSPVHHLPLSSGMSGSPSTARCLPSIMEFGISRAAGGSSADRQSNY